MLRRGRILRAWAKWCLVCVAVLLPPAWATSAQAAVELRIQISGLFFNYDDEQSGSLFDSGSIAGGRGAIAEATPVTRVDFILGTQLVGSYVRNDGIYCDFLFDGIYNIPKAGGSVTTVSSGPSFGFDLLSPTTTTRAQSILALDLDTARVDYMRTQNGSSVQFSFVAGGPSAGVVAQNLPFGLSIDAGQLIAVRVSSVNVTNRTEVGDYVTDFTTSGTGAVLGVVPISVPEPACFAALLAMGIIALEFRSRRRKPHNNPQSRLA